MLTVITGGAGFIGSHVAEVFVKRGYEVLILDDLSTGNTTNLHPSCRLLEGDVRDSASVDNAIQGADIVIHLAAFTSVPESFERFRDCYDVNVAGTYNVLQACAHNGVKQLVFASSSAVYAEFPDLLKAEIDCPDPVSPYAVSKLEGEHLLQLYDKRHGVSTLALRFFNVYGPRQPLDSDYSAVIPVFVHDGLKERPFTIYGDGHQTRDFVFVRDVADAVYRAATSSTTGVLNVGTGHAVEVLDIANMISALVGIDCLYTCEDIRSGDIRSSTADIREIKRVLGWSPNHSLEDGLGVTLEWYEKHMTIREA